MTKGKDVKQLYTRLGLKPADYQEVRAEEEVMHSVEERWPLLRDLLQSLAQSLDEVDQPLKHRGEFASSSAPPVSDVQPVQNTMTSSDVPAAAEPVVEPPPPTWLQEEPVVDVHANLQDDSDPEPDRDHEHDTAPQDDIPPPALSKEPELDVSADINTGQAGESLAARLARLYGDNTSGENETTPAEPAAPPASAESFSASESVDEPDEQDVNQAVHEERPQPSEQAPSGRTGLLATLLSRKPEREQRTTSEPVVAQDAPVTDAASHDSSWEMQSADGIDEPPPINLPDDDLRGQTAVASAAEVAPPAAEKPAKADAPLSNIFQRLAPGRERAHDVETEKPKAEASQEEGRRDLQSTFARLRKAGQ